jgi:predicted flap endonuclease-1-like 5' DNA nuclease
VQQSGLDDRGLWEQGAAAEGERLQAALEALAARDQVLADRTRRLAALEGAASRLSSLAARLEQAEEELATLRRARAAEAAAREERIGQLERGLAERPLPIEDSAPSESSPEAPAGEDDPGVLARLQQDLELERRRNARLAGRREDGAGGVARLQEELDAARRRAAALERDLAEMQRAAGPAGAYAHWERWFRQKLADREASDLARLEEARREQRSVLEEKERLIARLIDRLRAMGEIHEGPDDLKQVVGIGPVIEELLHGLGITTFEQLAALSEEEVDRIAGLLGVFHERIRRDRWVEQAADLASRRLRLGPGLSLR